MLNPLESAFREDSLSASLPYRVGRAGMGDFPFHWHSSIEIIYMLKGELACRINDNDYNLVSGDIVVINSRDLHAYYKSSNPKNDLILIRLEPSFYRSTGYLSDRDMSPVKMFSKQKYFPPTDQNHKELKAILDKIVKELETDDEVSSLQYSSAFLEILLFFCRLERATENPVNHKEAERFRNILGFIAENYQREITLADGADAVCLSPFHFTRVFKEYTGQTFSQYLRTYRIKYACHLLLTTELPVTDIAYDSGYSSLKTFYRQFKTIEGVNPGEYRTETAIIENK